MYTKNNKKKGFTLVELLVVIAIIAILATVSVVGYLGFTQKAHESKAVSELTQVKTVMLADLADGVEGTANDNFKFDGTTLTVTGFANAKSFTEKVTTTFKDLNGLEGTLDFNGTVVTYTLKDGKAKAQWTINSGVVEVTK